MAPATDGQTLSNLVNLYMGIGVLSLPWSLAGASLLGGVIIMACCVSWSAWTNIVLVTFAERTQKFSLGEVLTSLPGGGLLKPLGTCVLFGTNFLALVGYMVVFADNTGKVLVQGLLGEDVHGHTRLYLIAAGCVLAFPLCLLDQSRLAFFSKISIAANWYIVFVMIYAVLTADAMPRVCLVGYGIGDITMATVVVMAVGYQQVSFSVYREMENRTVRNFTRLQLTALVIGFALLATVSVSGYLFLGEDVVSNVLVALPQTFPNLFAQALIIPVVLGIYPQMMYPICTALKEIIFRDASQADEKAEQLLQSGNKEQSVGVGMTIVKVCLITAAGLIAATGVDLGPVNNVSGIFFLSWCTVILPGLSYHQLCQLDGKSKLLVWVHLSVGAVLTVLAVLFRGNHLQSVEKHCAVWGAA